MLKEDVAHKKFEIKKMNFYNGLSAQYYDTFFHEVDEQELTFYQRCIISSPAPALEIACGTGRIMLPLLEKGLQVEGFDDSQEMLEILQQKASQKQIHPTVYHQTMQSLALPKKYGCLFSPLGSFQQLADIGDAYKALQCFYEHLIPGGMLVIYLYIPWYNAPQVGLWHEHDAILLCDGKVLRVFEKAVHDLLEQRVHLSYRYEIWQTDKLLLTEQKKMCIRWYSCYEFELMLQSVGFKDIEVNQGYQDDGPADVMIFMAYK